MPVSTVSSTAPVFEVLTQEGIEEIHRTTMRVLEEIGIDFFHEEALGLFRGAGALVDGDRVRIPERLVSEALQEAPSSVTFYTRDGEPAMLLEGYEVHFGTYGTAPFFYDPYTGERRQSTKQSIANAAKVCDYLPHIEWSMPMGVPSDVPIPMADRHQFHQAIINQRKPLYSSAYTAAGMADVVEMAAVIAGGKAALRQRPYFTTGIDPSSPFRYGEEVLGKLLVMAEAGLPIILNPMPMSGGLTPTTMASTIVVALAEDLAGLTLAQLKNPGVPVIMGGVLTTMDMGTTVCTYGAPELTLMMAGITQMCRFYEVPSYGTAGCSNSKVVDPQAAIEATNSILGSALAGSNLIHDVGIIDNGMTVSLEALVMCDEIIAMTRRIAGGILVDEETLAFDLMKKVGPGGHFLAAEHTLRHFREHHQSKLIDRRNYDGWVQDGAKTMNDRMQERVHWILEYHEPVPLPEDVLAELDRMLQRFSDVAV
jgi:trimethylamine--corrinoid protein Co-methyltransferase